MKPLSEVAPGLLAIQNPIQAVWTGFLWFLCFGPPKFWKGMDFCLLFTVIYFCLKKYAASQNPVRKKENHGIYPPSPLNLKSCWNIKKNRSLIWILGGKKCVFLIKIALNGGIRAISFRNNPC